MAKTGEAARMLSPQTESSSASGMAIGTPITDAAGYDSAHYPGQDASAYSSEANYTFPDQSTHQQPPPYGYGTPPPQVVISQAPVRLVGRRLKPEGWLMVLILLFTCFPLACVPCCIPECYENVYYVEREVVRTATVHTPSIPVAQPYQS